MSPSLTIAINNVSEHSQPLQNAPPTGIRSRHYGQKQELYRLTAIIGVTPAQEEYKIISIIYCYLFFDAETCTFIRFFSGVPFFEAITGRANGDEGSKAHASVQSTIVILLWYYHASAINVHSEVAISQ